MKGLILEKRGKRIIALCLVILQVLFQFPVNWEVEANETDKKKVIIQFQNQDQKNISRGEGSLQLDMLVFFRGDNEGNEEDVEKNADEIDPEEKASSNLIPDIHNNGEKASDSSLRTNGRVSDSSIFQEETTRKIKRLSEEEVNKIIEKAASKNLDPSYRLILASSYEGKTNGSGKVVHEILQEYFHKNHIIFLSIRGVYKGISVERLIEYKDGERQVDNLNNREDTDEILLTFKEKPVWPGKLEIKDIPEQVFKDEKALKYSVNAKYNNGETPPREIEYYLEDSKKQRKRIENHKNFLIEEPGIYKVFAIIPGDENHSDLIAEADLPARKAYTGKYFTEEIQKIKLVENHKIELQINPDIETKAILEVVKNEDLVTISNQNEIWMKNQIGDIIVNATIPSWTQGGIPYQGFTEKLIIKIQPGSQSDFQFAPSEFIKRVTVDNDVSTYEYKIPYGLTNINGSGDHSFSLKTIGQKSTGKVVYELEDGGQIADLDKEHGILTFKDGQIGTVIVSATAPASEDSSYESKKIVAKINISYTDNIIPQC